MPEEPTTPDLVELTQPTVEVANERDLDGALSFFADDAVFDMSSAGIGTFEGHEAMRGLYEDWLGAYEDFQAELEEVRDLGYGVTFSVFVQRGRLPGSKGWVQLRYGAVTTWADGLIRRVTNYIDIDQARAAAERLAEERVDG
jgi:ketosteroid isomerase-like protein